MVIEPADADPQKKYKTEMMKAKWLILDGVKDHVLCHIASRGTAKEMWDALSTLYQGSSKQRKMYLEQKLRSAQMQKGERVDPFLTTLKETLLIWGSIGCALSTEMVWAESNQFGRY